MRLPIGLMLEVPAAAVSIESLLEIVDFVSIGSNDLVQYLMAADRDNPKVSHLCQPLSPPVLQVLNGVDRGLQQGRQAGHAVRRNGRAAAGVCAVDRHGAAQLQHEPGLYPHDQRPDATSDDAGAEEILAGALRFKTTNQVNRFMAEQISLCARTSARSTRPESSCTEGGRQGQRTAGK